MLNRYSEEGFLEVMDEFNCGVISFSPLAQGLLTDKYSHGIPASSRAASTHGHLTTEAIDSPTLTAVSALHDLANARGQSLAEMAIAWNLRHPQMASVIIGASKPQHVIANLKALQNLSFTGAELRDIDRICAERTAAQALIAT